MAEAPVVARPSRWPSALALLVVATHLLVNALAPYGVHRDEFLYFAMGRHLRFWRMDFPPAIAVVSELQRTLFGDSLVAVRLVPAIAAGALVLLAARAAREVGGGRTAQALAALAVAANPLFLRAGNLFQPVVLDQLTWTLALLALLRLCTTRDDRWWLAVGAAMGLGLLVKFSIVFLGAGVLLATLATPHRRALLRPWPWLAFGIAILLGSPSIAGQLTLGWPVLGQMRELQQAQLAHVSYLDFVIGQLTFGPAVLLAAYGVVASLRRPELRRFAVVTLSCLGAFVVLLALRGKPYYLGPVYPVLFGIGAAALERTARRSWTRAATLAVATFGLWTLPVGIPILAPAAMHTYLTRAGLGESLRTNRDRLGLLPQDYADMLGWPAMVDTVGRVYHALSPEDRARAVVIAGNYGEAGAIDFYGPARGLPPVVSTAGSYWFFGPGELPGDVAVIIGPSTEELRPYFEQVQEVARTGVGDPWLVDEEQDVPVHVARRPRKTLQAIWPNEK